jgi:hypothetical protein
MHYDASASKALSVFPEAAAEVRPCRTYHVDQGGAGSWSFPLRVTDHHDNSNHDHSKSTHHSHLP